jgi:hypothetical protein
MRERVPYRPHEQATFFFSNIKNALFVTEKIKSYVTE